MQRRRSPATAIRGVLALMVMALIASVPGTLPAAAEVDSFVSDDFDSVVLDPVWSVVDGRGDGSVATVGAGSGDAHLELSVPGGPSHDAWVTNNSLRVMQPAADEDFEVEAKFDTAPSKKYQSMGVLVEGAGGYLRFDYYSTGSQLRFFAAELSGGSGTSLVDVAAPSGTSLWLRVSRSGGAWTVSTSTNGVDFTPRVSFSSSLSVSSVGPFVGNYSSKSAPAFTGLVDYFFNTAAPIVPEDGGGPAEEYSVSVSTVGSGSVTRSPDLASYPAGSQVTLTAVPDEGWSFDGWSGGVSGSQNPVTVTVSSDLAVTATFSEDGQPPEGPVIDVWYGSSQSLGSNGTTQRWLDVTGNVSDPDSVSSLSYRLNGGTSKALSWGPNGRRLVNAGDFVADILVADLVAGPNSVQITATDSQGSQSTTVVTVNYQPTVPALPFNVEWGGVADITQVAHVVDGEWSTSSGRLRTTAIGYDRLVALGDRSMTDYEVTVPVTVHSFSANPGPNSGDPAVGILMRWNGHNDTVTPGSQPQQGWTPDGVNDTPFGAYALYRARSSSPRLELRDHRASIKGTQGVTLQPGTTYVFKVRADANPGSGATTYSFKAWAASDPEPAGWTLQFTAGTSDDQPASGSVVLLAHEADVSFGDVTVTPVP